MFLLGYQKSSVTKILLLPLVAEGEFKKKSDFFFKPVDETNVFQLSTVLSNTIFLTFLE